MLEIEIKAFCKSHDEVEKKLMACGAEFKELVNEEDVYFQHPSRDFSKTGEAFRLRRINDKYCITYKGPKLSSKAKTRFEEETFIDDAGKAVIIFEKLGFKKAGSVRKKRKIYFYNSAEICLDEVEGLGCFVEIEKMGDDPIPVENELFEIASLLDLNEFTSVSYLNMLMGVNDEKD
ncbi:MAG: class IV adenylate cyclase [Spirochaetes bacterium]|nr:class IV adenylate cyclase [Spirochaetota bacterium]